MVKRLTKKQQKVFWQIIASFSLLIVVSLIAWLSKLENPVILCVLYLLPYLIIGHDILRKAFLGIIHGQVFDENFLMAIATVGAMALGEYREGAAVMLFYQIGELFQSIAVGKSRESIKKLMDIRPEFARLTDGEEVDPEDVEPGTEIEVLPGERIPIDGVVIFGQSFVNTAAITGESVPRAVGVNDEVMSGCINENGRLIIRTTKAFSDSVVARILDMMENAGMKKSRSEAFITRFAKVYTPVVCLLALLLAFLVPGVLALLGKEVVLADWIKRALTFLVISCPCALVISIPLSFFGGIGGASAKGVLVKGSCDLEHMAMVRTIAFDKTGTLTKGVFSVVKILPEKVLEEELLWLCATAESGSLHPISKSIREEAEKKGVKPDASEVTEAFEQAGFGLKAVVSGDTVLCGNARLLEKEGIDFTAVKESGTLVYVAKNGVYLGCLVIDDVEKPEAQRAMKDLSASGIKTVMLTGDHEAAAKHMAQKMQVGAYQAELLPDGKVGAVENMLSELKEGEKLAFVGDGINDAPVLCRADVGIAMGGVGSDAAIEAADVVLMDDDPGKIMTAMKIARKTLRIVRENIVLALGVKGVCLVLGAFGLANMWMAIFADVGVMVLAVLNATRTMSIKE